MEPSMSTKDRHCDVKKAEFFRQIFKKEHSFETSNKNSHGGPRPKPFVFRQTYSQTSQNSIIDGTNYARSETKSSDMNSMMMPSPSPIKAQPQPFVDSHGFSSFKFQSSLTSAVFGEHIDNVKEAAHHFLKINFAVHSY
jgi:hypothetical protein